MDPNANLADQEELLQELSEYADSPTHPAAQNAAADLHERRRDMRVWLKSGGFEPDWSLAPRARAYYRR